MHTSKRVVATKLVTSQFRSLPPKASPFFLSTRLFRRRRRPAASVASPKSKGSLTSAGQLAQAPAPAPSARSPPDDLWVAVTDEKTKGVYYWNQKTNETTAVGAPKPLSPPEPAGPVGGMGGGGLMSTLAEGMMFGAGSSIAHRAMDSLMGPRQVEHVHAAEEDGGQNEDVLGSQSNQEVEGDGWEGGGGFIDSDDGDWGDDEW